MDNEKPIDAKETLTRLFQFMECFGFTPPRTDDENFALFKQFFECFGDQKPQTAEQTEDEDEEEPEEQCDNQESDTNDETGDEEEDIAANKEIAHDQPLRVNVRLTSELYQVYQQQANDYAMATSSLISFALYEYAKNKSWLSWDKPRGFHASDIKSLASMATKIAQQAAEIAKRASSSDVIIKS